MYDSLAFIHVLLLTIVLALFCCQNNRDHCWWSQNHCWWSQSHCWFCAASL